MRSLLLVAALLACLLSGCLVEEGEPTDGAESTQSPAAQAAGPTAVPAALAAQDDGAPQGVAPAPHGEPQWTTGAITTGTDPSQVPSGWARQDVTVQNGFGDLASADLTAGIAAGSITVLAADRADYLVQATLEVRATSEADAKATLERTRLDHQDSVRDGVLMLSDQVVTDPVPGTPPLPIPVTLPGISSGPLSTPQLIVTYTITFPLPPKVSAHLDAASGDVSVSDLVGDRLDADTASGDITVQACTFGAVDAGASSGSVRIEDVVADTLAADTSSGDVTVQRVTIGKVTASSSSGDLSLKGAISAVDASTSSGGVVVDATPSASGTFALDASSGDLRLTLPSAGAYDVEADTSSGDVDVDVAGATTDEEDGHAEATSPGYKDAAVKTKVDASTSSGDITVDAA